MDVFTADRLAKGEGTSLPEPDDGDDATLSEPGASSPARSKKRGFRGLLSKASMQDQLLEK